MLSRSSIFLVRFSAWTCASVMLAFRSDVTAFDVSSASRRYFIISVDSITVYFLSRLL